MFIFINMSILDCSSCQVYIVQDSCTTLNSEESITSGPYLDLLNGGDRGCKGADHLREARKFFLGLIISRQDKLT